MSREFLPVTRAEMEERGIWQPDFVYISGDAYVDHPSFGAAIITRLLESRGYSVGIISQPDWRKKESISVFGEPRLAFLVSAGNMDSMVNHYTVAKKHRRQDSYSPGGQMGLRPDRAVTVYGNLIRQTYKDTPVILGGIEASLRRLAHYDYWSDSMKRSVLMDSGADLISYGMGEHSILEIAEALDKGIPVSSITFVPGTVYKAKKAPEGILLPSFEALSAKKEAYAGSFRIQYENTDPFTGKVMAESYGTKGFVVQNPPAKPLTQKEMDEVYELPYMGTYHPMYEKQGKIPAIEEIQFSITSNRGCFGGCNFCALAFHQGRIVQTRSHGSILREAESYREKPDFKGYIHDVGGPTADFRHPSCKKQMTKGICTNRQCLFPKPCKNLEADHRDYLELLRKLRHLPGIKKVFIRSGIRFDYVNADPSPEFLNELAAYHVSGQLRVAPEHVSDHVLYYMGKPEHKVYEEFLKKFQRANEKSGKRQFVVPYLMSSHPGCTIKEAVKLAEYVRDMGFMPEQVQDFYPTPSTMSTCMYYTGLDPRTGEKVYVPKSAREKAMQRALLQYKNPENYELVKEALLKSGRSDLIGFDKKCLIRPRGGKGKPEKEHVRDFQKKQVNSRENGRKKKSIRNVHKKKSGGR
ncbi:YgiQ family radical SAM protein [Blautia hansenii]|uniref:YgiQ family radical SAM protein n=1 Tax=Blautia hansenii TaxID=1322 RepID=A0ABX2IB22_BLAHA|nr:YgiQ family radical SAM protein [Blautia hansenii]MCB5600529.1 YgiQ family radical SAM protein [Blautia hansenii]NSJ86097.1 YgiQ family radical SAM protein [Blautia hansenii]